MILRLALRTLAAHPVRTLVLAAGFGTGVSVMAILLGVAQVVLEQARSPLLVGGGDVVVTEMVPGVPRLLTASTLRTAPFDGRTVAVSPNSRDTLYLVSQGREPIEVKVRAGVPSQEKALGDPEVVDQAAWTDRPGDAPWTAPDPKGVLGVLDHFHAIPDVPARADSWAEWLYFNGRTPTTRFYLTFLAGPRLPNGMRAAGVRLQLERNGVMESFSGGVQLPEAALDRAPDLDFGGNTVRLSGFRYDIHLDLTNARGQRARADFWVEADRGRQMPPIELKGAGGWVSGYVVPALSGTIGGGVTVDAGKGTVDTVRFDGGTGYHDHNWGFWKDVSWQWGQVHHGDVSLVYGRVFPPKDAADPERIPGFLGVIGTDGPLGYTTRVRIEETNVPGTDRPSRITITGRGSMVDLVLDFGVDSIETNRMSGPMANALDFLQMRGTYEVKGSVGDTPMLFTSPGSAETFRGR